MFDACRQEKSQNYSVSCQSSKEKSIQDLLKKPINEVYLRNLLKINFMKSLRKPNEY